ncbi:arsenite methyltransferase [Thiohalospira sp.]|uniref:arsenite methyltransferase n=1 Tax=Thiohalospira sp. TaxID=3080549 RepID=UPI003980954B
MSDIDEKARQGSCCGPQVEREPAGDHQDLIRNAYARVAENTWEGGASGTESACCGGGASEQEKINTLFSTRLGYSESDLLQVPEGADMGLGCGNPNAIAALRPGEVVVDLGAGGGFDCFLAAREVGEAGRVIGVDMTPEMVSKARNNAVRGDFANVEFRLGEIEHLPVADDTADVILSNCVINLSNDKPGVFREAWRILKPGGRLAISDVVASVPLPPELSEDTGLIAGCMGNASLIEDLERMMVDAGFRDIAIEPKDDSREFIRDWAPGRGVDDYVVSATIEAIKPTLD